VPVGVTVSVRIPHSYYHRVRERQGPRAPPATPDSAAIQLIEQDTIAQVQKMVAGLLPPPSANFRAEVVVTTFTDLSPDNWSLNAFEFWTQRLRLNPTVIVSVVGLAGMVVWLVRGLWRDLTLREGPTASTAPPQSGPDLFSPTGPTTESPPTELLTENPEIVHRELTRLVREDPDTAAEMLGEWVRKAG
jgi:flagellar biosynthesis/type III secretory pathway M-ring protein FliF/YscJ